MYLPENSALIYQVYNVIPYTKQGTRAVVGGGFTTVSGVPSQQLLASSNTVLGYNNGQMLAVASGLVSGGGSSGLTAGALINFDPSSPSGDTGQKKWNGFIICDDSITNPFPLLNPITGAPFVPLNTIDVATQGQGWVIRQQFLYAGGTPITDAAIVQTAVAAFGNSLAQFACMNSSGNTETLFSY